MPEKIKILIVDDIQENRRLLRKTLEWHGHTVEEAGNGAEALEVARKEMPDMIISDVLMPVMDGFQLCRNVKKDKKLKGIPVIFHSSTYSDKESEKLALDLGAAAYIVKPIEPDKFIRMIEDAFNKQKKEGGKPVKKPLEEKVYMKLYNERLVRQLEKKMLVLEREVVERKRIEEELEQSFESLRKGLDATINVLVAAVEVRDPYTAGHQNRVADLARAIATEMGLPKEKIEGIRVAGAIHDIGKISVPSEILSKPGSLNDSEFGLIKSHSQVGYDILKNI